MAWTNVKGFNFRATSGFVTDGTNQTYDLGAVYPRSVTIDSDTFNVGWASDTTANTRDRINSQGANFAGMNFRNNSSGAIKWKIDLPAAGQYTIRLALGEHDNVCNIFCRIFDNASVLSTVASGVSTNFANGFVDATGVARTSPSDWTTNNASVTLTFASQICFIEIGDPTAIGGGNSDIAHFDIVALSGGGQPPMYTQRKVLYFI
jgi:hypothetical protein